MRIITNRKGLIWTLIIVLIVVLVGGGFWTSKRQHAHFNRNISINGVNVGGMTTTEAVSALQNAKWSNKIYVGSDLVVSGKSTKSSFSNADLNAVSNLQKKQYTFFPSSKKKDFQLKPQKISSYRTGTLKNQLRNRLVALNANRTKAQDAYAVMRNGSVKIIPAKKGNQYNVATIMKEYNKRHFDSEIHLSKVILQPLSANSSKIKNDKSKLEDLASHSIEYKVQNKTYNIKAKDVFDEVTYRDGQYSYNTKNLKKEISSINKKQATLHKNYRFKMPTGKTVTVPGVSYGWALSDTKAEKTIANALINNKKTVDAEPDIYGLGYNTGGTGYDNLSNDGIGKTYAVISISQQRAWLYRNGKQVYAFNVVTGKHSTGEDTPRGVFYIMYKQSPSVLRGSESGAGSYSQPVQYWAQFTGSGCGFHDASWRTNWSSSAYLTDGSGGCANTQPSDMPTVYKNLSQNEPVIVY